MRKRGQDRTFFVNRIAEHNLNDELNEVTYFLSGKRSPPITGIQLSYWNHLAAWANVTTLDIPECRSFLCIALPHLAT